MKYYRLPETGEVFAYESAEERQNFGAPELVEMTASEVDAFLNPDPPPDYLGQIEALEREHMAPRYLRDFTLGAMEREAIVIGASQGLSEAQAIAALRAGNAGYRKLKELDEQIAALRALL